MSTEQARKEVCDEIQEIMRVYREQRPEEFGTPGGLEHMGDVWNLFEEWEAKLSRSDVPEDRSK